MSLFLVEMYKNRVIYLGFDKIAELLIEKGSVVDAVGQDGHTLLISAADKGMK